MAGAERRPVTVVSYGARMADSSGSWPLPADTTHPVAARDRHDVDDSTARAAELFAAQYSRLAGWCRKLLDDEDTAHEIAMEAFTRLLGRLRRVDEPVGYLYVVAANLIRDHWRRTKRERGALRLSVSEYAPSGDPELRDLVESLPERLRISVLLYYYAGFPVGDVARLTNRPIGTVKSDLFQARAVLRRALDRAE
jgi:RNA polymerase sigma-70 factor, ECF subfamily